MGTLGALTSWVAKDSSTCYFKEKFYIFESSLASGVVEMYEMLYIKGTISDRSPSAFFLAKKIPHSSLLPPIFAGDLALSFATTMPLVGLLKKLLSCLKYEFH
ncbi:Uncharacterized protein Fot_34460 [Forsythia ovata]|uniref:Maturase K n=1 Tax=Forsythia ovata TaxID=205694 RepID=A0ABD1SIR7_9LAMI